MNAKQIYRIRVDYVDADDKLHRQYSYGKFARRERMMEWIHAQCFRIQQKGGRMIFWGIYDTSALPNRIVESSISTKDDEIIIDKWLSGHYNGA